jgi:hypothetical protein
VWHGGLGGVWSAHEPDGSAAWAEAAPQASKDNTIPFVANTDIATSSLSDSPLQEVETDGRGGATTILQVEAEADSAGTQPC